MGKDGKLRDKDGNVLTAQDIAEREALATQPRGKKLAGVTAIMPGNSFGASPGATSPLSAYQVEYITGGGSDGTAKTLWVEIQEKAGNE